MVPSNNPTDTPILLYQNDFEDPNLPIAVTCGSNLNSLKINEVFGTDLGRFRQTYTVETVI
eukprot:CAMPEP_0119023542 /NCGR_PEP_ID=MMETSP1176-20130426/30148_1 /TAXON_ID=265551 /ORGANISM="Synedropsis recta cf, Strain CCMP1620" /LENGTH=60 /DNA_ID=CAMNT_0006978633 /DNA_START=130 /DNA_END=309 /DNA_ORIENTATION=+